MSSVEELYQFLQDSLHILRLHGLHQLVLSPGSRSAPLALSVLRSKSFDTYLIPDERSAAYFALGLAKQNRAACGLICTSGTAVLNYGPAVAEAYFQEIPLVLLTADRPPERIDKDDNQAIFQEQAYGKHVRYYAGMPDHYGLSSVRNKAFDELNLGMQKALKGPRGPVHFNFPFREPFYPDTELDLKPGSEVKINLKNESVRGLQKNLVTQLAQLVANSKRIWLVAGMGTAPEVAADLDVFCEATSALLIADPLSGIESQQALRHYDHWLDEQVEAPDLVISMGHQHLSKKLKQFLTDHPAGQHFHVQPHPEFRDLFGSLRMGIEASEADFFGQINQLFQGTKLESDYVKGLKSIDQSAGERIRTEIKNAAFEEYALIADLFSELSTNQLIHLGNSTPARYPLSLWTYFKKHPELYANRGASGIDGSFSTAMGMSQGDDRLPVVILGDLSLMYDSNGLWHEHLPEHLLIVVVNNGGGGIFRRIKGPSDQAELENYFCAGGVVNFAGLAQQHGLAYKAISERGEWRETIAGIEKLQGRHLWELKLN